MNRLGLLVLPVVSIAIAGLLLFLGGDRLQATPGFTTVYEAQSLYGRVRVVDESERQLRWLLSDSSTTRTLLLFSVPLTLLAMVGPRVIQLCTSRLESVGRSSGSVYAFSTVGSVLGTLVLGFFLLPILGTQSILYGVSVGLLILAAVLALYERARRNTLGLLVLPFVSIAIAGLLLFMGGDRLQATLGFTTVYEAQSLYGRVRVVDESERQLRW